MANIIENKLIAGKELLAALHTGGLQNLAPRPKWQDDNWFEWNITHWGTKWDIYKGAILDGECLYFLTANGGIHEALTGYYGIEYYDCVDIDDGEDPETIDVSWDIVNRLLRQEG